MRVCFVSHSSTLGGAELALLELIDASRGRDVEFRVLLPAEGMLGEELRRRDVPFAVRPYEWWVYLSIPGRPSGVRPPLHQHLERAPAVAEAIDDWGCDVVCSNTTTACVGALAATLLGLPHVWSIHELSSFLWHSDIAEETGPCLRFDLGYERALGLIDELSAMCMVNSAATATVYGRFIPPHKLRVVAQAVDWNVVRADTRHDTTSVWPADTMRCLMIASLVPWKGQTDAIRAMAVLRDRRVPATLVLAGKGVGTGYETEIAGLITELELADRVTLLEDFVDPAAFIRAADVVLVCSLCEAFGRITVEATRLGKPVVGTNSGATPELVREGFNGLLYAPGDDQALADRIAYLRARPDEAVRLGRNGAEWAAAEFGPERYAGAASVCFEEAVGIGGQVDRGGRTVMGLLSARMLALGRERLGFEREARALEMECRGLETECRGLETECGGLERQLTELRQQPLVQVSGVLRREGPSGLVRRSLRRLLGRRRVREDVRPSSGRESE